VFKNVLDFKLLSQVDNGFKPLGRIIIFMTSESLIKCMKNSGMNNELSTIFGSKQSGMRGSCIIG